MFNVKLFSFRLYYCGIKFLASDILYLFACVAWTCIFINRRLPSSRITLVSADCLGIALFLSLTALISRRISSIFLSKIFHWRCGCGRLLEDHNSNIPKVAEEGKWLSSTHTIKKPSFQREILFHLNETVGNRSTASRVGSLTYSNDTFIVFCTSLHN